MRTFKSRLIQAVEAMAEAAKLEVVQTFAAKGSHDVTHLHLMSPGSWRTVARVRVVLDSVGFELHFARLVDGEFVPARAGLNSHPTIRYHDEDGIVAALEAVRKGIEP